MAWLLVVFLVLFPKGGLKVGLVPLTWGYLIIAFTAPALLVYRLLYLPLRSNVAALAALASALPFQTLFLYSYRANGVGSLDFAVSVAVSFLVLPMIFLELYPQFSPLLDQESFRRVFCGSIFLAAAYGIFLFFFRPITGHLVEIPLLTVNLSDYGQIESTKHIARGSFLKLISTYNNGNLYGVCTLMLLPLYTTLEPRRWRHHLVRGALLLTLSRTVWVGLLAEQALAFGRPLLATVSVFPRLALRGTGRRLLAIGVLVCCILIAVFSSSYKLSFLLDPTLGGRFSEITTNNRAATLLPSVPILGFAEVLFASAVTNYGYIGMLTLVLLFVFPFLLVAAKPAFLRDSTRKAAAKGLLLYLLVSFSDGATNLIPVMAFYWFTYSVLIYGLPGIVVSDPRRVPAKESRFRMPARTRYAVEPRGPAAAVQEG